MIARRYRFHGHGSLNYLYRNGKTARNRLFVVRSVPNRRRQTSRLSVIVGKKVVKSAVLRNRIRRRVYEVVRRHWNQVAAPVDIALTVVSSETIALPPLQLEQQVVEVLSRAQLYQPSQSSVIVGGTV